ncbi:MAG: hypothetical protein ACTSRS_02280 [Candidatus Helarchaeota archaeon]
MSQSKPLDLIPTLKEIQCELEEFFSLIQINYKEKLTSIQFPNELGIKENLKPILTLISKISHATHHFSSINTLMNYREFGEVITRLQGILQKLPNLLHSDFEKFYRMSHYLLQYYWGIRYIIARFELESFPDYLPNQIMFFNIPDVLFEFLESLRNGSRPVEVLAEIALEIRTHKTLPLLLNRGVDEISLSDLGKQFFEVYEISDFFFYYFYDFPEDVLKD